MLPTFAQTLLRSLLLLTFALSTAASARAQQDAFVGADHPDLVYVGRVSFARPEAPTFTYPGVQIHALFEGTSVAMKSKPEAGYYMVEIDTLPAFKVHPQRPDSIAPLASGLAQGTHRLTLTYCNEGMVLHPEFYGLVLDTGCSLAARPALPNRRIEFIGNSITCGYGNEGSLNEKSFSYKTQNAYLTYAAMAARALGAQWMSVARSGIGIYRNYGGNREGDKITMPALYEHTLLGTRGERWDFGRFTPNVVCVNLGTNDISLGNYDADLLAAAFCRFVSQLRSHYPQAKIVLLTGPMSKADKHLAALQDAQRKAVADAAARGDHEVYRFDFTPADGSLGYGTHYHPTLAQHRLMADELVPFLRQITGWQ